MRGLRTRLAAILFWAFLKVMPSSQFKNDVVDAIVSLRGKYPRTHP